MPDPPPECFPDADGQLASDLISEHDSDDWEDASEPAESKLGEQIDGEVRLFELRYIAQFLRDRGWLGLSHQAEEAVNYIKALLFITETRKRESEIKDAEIVRLQAHIAALNARVEELEDILATTQKQLELYTGPKLKEW